MKLITAIAALALLAGSMDVEAQKRGKANNPPGGGKPPGTHQKAPEGAEAGEFVAFDYDAIWLKACPNRC